MAWMFSTAVTHDYTNFAYLVIIGDIKWKFMIGKVSMLSFMVKLNSAFLIFNNASEF